MNNSRIKMFGMIYEHILLLREALIEFLSEKIPAFFSDNWWEKAVVSTFIGSNHNTKACCVERKLVLELKDSCIYTFTRFDFRALLYILIHNWKDIISHPNNNIAKDGSIGLFYKIKEVRDIISHANDDNLTPEYFKKYITYLSSFATIINSTRITPEMLNKYLNPYVSPGAWIFGAERRAANFFRLEIKR